MNYSLDKLLSDFKKGLNLSNTGMVLVYEGIVRATSKEGKRVEGMVLSYDERKLSSLREELLNRDGVEGIEVIINKGKLKIGDTIMVVMLAGDRRKNVLPVFEELLSRLKEEVLIEEEF